MEKDTEKLNSQKKKKQRLLAKQMKARSGRGKVCPRTLQGTPVNLLVAHEQEHGHHRPKKLANTSSHKQVSVHAN